MNITKYQMDLLSAKASCDIYLKNMQKEEITKKDKRMYKRLYKDTMIEYKNLKRYIDNWIIITVETLENIESQLDKIKKNDLIPIKVKEIYIYQLVKDINYLNSELNKIVI